MASTELAALCKAPLLFGIVELDFHILFRWNWCFLWELSIKSVMAVHIYHLYSFLVFWKGWYCALPLYLSLSGHNSLPATSSPLSLPTLASDSHHTSVGIPFPPNRSLLSLKLCSLYDCKKWALCLSTLSSDWYWFTVLDFHSDQPNQLG